MSRRGRHIEKFRRCEARCQSFSVAKPGGCLNQCVEHPLQVEGRPVDSLENLSRRGFSSMSLAQLSLELLDCASKVLLSLDGGCVGRHNCAQSIEWRLLVSAGRHTKRLSTHPTLCQLDAPCSVLARDVCFRRLARLRHQPIHVCRWHTSIVAVGRDSRQRTALHVPKVSPYRQG